MHIYLHNKQIYDQNRIYHLVNKGGKVDLAESKKIEKIPVLINFLNFISLIRPKSVFVK